MGKNSPSKNRNLPKPRKIFEYWDAKIGDDYEIYEKQCFACGWSAKGKGLERCHIMARVLGGTDTVKNLHLLCKICHIQSECFTGDVYWEWFNRVHENWFEVQYYRNKQTLEMMREKYNMLNEVQKASDIKSLADLLLLK